MTNQTQHDDDFFDVADRFIDLANQINDKEPSQRVSAALLYACARYNVFHFAQTTRDKVKIREYLLGQYESMLNENLEDILK